MVLRSDCRYGLLDEEDLELIKKKCGKDAAMLLGKFHFRIFQDGYSLVNKETGRALHVSSMPNFSSDEADLILEGTGARLEKGVLTLENGTSIKATVATKKI